MRFLTIKKQGRFSIDSKKNHLIDLLFRKIDTSYYFDNKHKWSNNNLIYQSSEKKLYGKLIHDQFSFSEKHQFLKPTLHQIELKGTVVENNDISLVEYKINTKPEELISLIAINLIILSTFMIPSNEVITQLITLLFLILLNITTLLVLKHKIKNPKLNFSPY